MSLYTSDFLVGVFNINMANILKEYPWELNVKRSKMKQLESYVFKHRFVIIKSLMIDSWPHCSDWLAFTRVCNDWKLFRWEWLIIVACDALQNIHFILVMSNQESEGVRFQIRLLTLEGRLMDCPLWPNCDKFNTSTFSRGQTWPTFCLRQMPGMKGF